MVVTTYAEGAFGILSGSPYACLEELRAQGIYNSGKVIGFTQSNDSSLKDIMVMYWKGSRKILTSLTNWFRFSETSGSISYDEGSAGTTASLVSGAIFSDGMDSSVSGVGALLLSGTLGTTYNIRGHATIPADANIISNIGSICMWVKILNNARDQVIYEVVPYSEFSGVLALKTYFKLYISETSDRLTLDFKNSTDTYGDNFISVSGDSISVNTWTHIGATSDGSTTRVYVNGIESTTTSGVNVGQWTGDMIMSGGTSSHVRNIGYHIISGTVGEYFSGYIDNLRITNRLFNSEEMMQLYDARL